MSKQFRGIISEPVRQDIFNNKYYYTGFITPLKDDERSSQGFLPNVRTTIRTSLVVKEYEKGGKKFIETLNSIYELGE